MALRTRRLGTQGLEVSEQGLGCMGRSEFYGTADDQDVAAAEIEIGEQELAELDEIAPRGIAAGERYADMSLVHR